MVSRDDVRQGSVVSHTVFLAAAQATASLLGFGFWVIASRSYGYATIGREATTINAALLVALFAKLGLDSFLATHLGKDGNAGGLARIALWVTLAASVVLGVLVIPLSDGLDVQRIALGLSIGTALAIGLVLDGILIGVGRPRVVLARAAALGALRIALLLALSRVLGPSGAWGASAILWAWVLSGVVVALFVSTTLHRMPATAVARSEATGLVRSALSNSVASTVVAVPGLLFPILLAWRGQLELAGIFYLLWMIVALFHMVPTSMGLAILGNARSSRRRRQHAVAFSMAAVVAGGALLALAGRPLLHVYGGPLVAAHHAPTLVLAFSAVLACGNHYHMSTLRQQARWGSLAAAAVASATIALATAWYLIPQAGVWGIVLAWLLSQAALLAVTTLLVRSGRSDPHDTRLAKRTDAHRWRLWRRESRG